MSQFKGYLHNVYICCLVCEKNDTNNIIKKYNHEGSENIEMGIVNSICSDGLTWGVILHSLMVFELIICSPLKQSKTFFTRSNKMLQFKLTGHGNFVHHDCRNFDFQSTMTLDTIWQSIATSSWLR